MEHKTYSEMQKEKKKDTYKRQNEWIKNNVSRYNLTLKKDMDKCIKDAAEKEGESPAEYIRKAIDMRLQGIIDFELYERMDKVSEGEATKMINKFMKDWLES